MKSAKDILGFDDKWFIIIGIPLVALETNMLMFSDLMVDNPQSFFSRCIPVGIVYVSVYWFVYRYILIYLRRKLPSNKEYKKRLIWQAVIVVFGFFIIKKILDPILHPYVDSAVRDYKEHGISMSVAALTVSFLVLGIYEVITFYFQLQKSVLEKEQLKKENIHSQLETLKNQVNPHFLFNSLNTLAYLIPENPAKAEVFVQKLSKAYRYILEIREQELMPLEEELKFLESYNALLKERFGDNLKINIDVPDIFLKKEIVPLSLQMLFENAIKHNIISEKKPLIIEVHVEEVNQLIIKNNLQKKNQIMNSTKVGLENIKRRYHLVSGKEVKIISSEKSFVVILPLISKTNKKIKLSPTNA